MTDPTPRAYDLFISHSPADQEWVEDWLLPRLEESGLDVAVPSRDFDIGVPILVNTERAVDNSRRSLLVLSPAWVDSQWVEFEGLLTQTADPAARQRRLLPLLLEPCQPPRRIAMLSYADFTQPEDRETQLERVLAAIRGELRLREVGPELSRLLGPEEAPFLVPFVRNLDFVGRTEDLERLHQALTEQGTEARPVGVTGMGGIGKTQLAVEYAYRRQEDYPDGVLWINAAEPLTQGFAQLGRRLRPAGADRSLDEQIRAAVDYLRGHPDTLLILDNVTNPADLNRPVSVDLVPAALPCPTLFTTRRRDLGRFIPVELSVLAEKPALELLLRHPRRQAVLNPSHPEYKIARSICGILGYLPLALEVAGAHLGQWPGAPLDTYRQELLERGALPVLDDPRAQLQPEDLPTRHDAAMAATLAGQWETLTSDDARLLLRAAGQLPEAAFIPTARLGLLAGLDNQETGFFGSPLTLARRELEDASLMEELREGQVRLHPLVREFAAGQTAEAETDAFRARCAANLTSAYQDIVTLEDQCADRGIDALQEDLFTALNLLPSDSRSAIPIPQSAMDNLQSLLRLLQREAHNLRGWDREQRPAYFAQQLHNRATDLGQTDWAEKAGARLSGLNQPYLALRWRASRESPELEHTLAGHAAMVRAVAVTPDGRRAISGSLDRSLKIWNLRSGREEHTLAGHQAEVRCVVVVPDGRRAVSSSEDQTLKVWNLDSLQEERTLTGHGHEVLAVALTPDGRRAVSASRDRTLKVWNLNSGQVEHTLEGHQRSVRAVAVSADGRRAISASADRTLRVWDLETGRHLHTLRGHRASLRDVVLTPDGRRVVSASSDRTLKVWDLESRQEERTLSGHAGRVRAVTIIPDGRRAISSAEDRTIRVWDLESGQVERVLSGHGGTVWAVTTTPDGRRVISTSEDHTLKVWDLEATRGHRPLTGHTGRVLDLAITPDGDRLISVSADNSLKVWDLASGREQHSLVGHSDQVRAVALSPDGDAAISSSSDGTLKVWNLDTGQEESTLTGHSAPVTAVALTPDAGQVVSASYDGSLKIWGISTGLNAGLASEDEAYSLTGHLDRVLGLAFTPDGRYLVSASGDHSLKVWDISTGLNAGLEKSSDQAVHTLTGHWAPVLAVAALPVGEGGSFRAVSVSADRTARVWNLDTGEEEHTLAGHSGALLAVAVSPDGRLAATASVDGTLKLWNIESGQELRTLTGHTDRVVAAAFTPGGGQVVSVSADRSLRVWDTEGGQCLAVVSLEGALGSLTLAPDGTTFAVGDGAGNVYCLRYNEAGG